MRNEGIDFIKLIENPTWKDVLLGLVHREELDPWNIDLNQVTEKYIEVIRNMKEIELHVPANLILAASILLKFKSESLKFKEDKPEEELIEEEFYEDNFIENPMTEIPNLTYRPRFPKKRKVTLEELVKAVDEALKTKTKRRERLEREHNMISHRIEELEVDKFDVERVVQKTYEEIIEKMDKYNTVNFNEIAKNESKIDMVRKLLAILYLYSKEYLEIIQEKIFGDIIIRVIKEDKVNIGVEI